jgi:hypothetical protein
VASAKAVELLEAETEVLHRAGAYLCRAAPQTIYLFARELTAAIAPIRASVTGDAG